MEPRRPAQEVYDMILKFARNDERVRAVLLNGSRANPNIAPDRFSDFDIVYVVKDFNTFISDHQWVNIFGRMLIMQMPDEMLTGNNEKEGISFGYLMLFDDGNRIDLTLFPADRLNTHYKKDSLTQVLLDKDNLFSQLPPASETDYLIKMPSQKEFSDCCNEFWWVSTYVAKGLFRDEITYAKEMMEKPVRDMLMNAIQWYICANHRGGVSFGKAGKNMQRYLPATIYQRILATYPDADAERIWAALFLMGEVFNELMIEVATRFGFEYNVEEARQVTDYLKNVQNWSKEK